MMQLIVNLDEKIIYVVDMMPKLDRKALQLTCGLYQQLDKPWDQLFSYIVNNYKDIVRRIEYNQIANIIKIWLK